MCDNIRRVASNHASIRVEANKMADTFAEALKLFSLCHSGYNSSQYTNDQEIDKLGKNYIFI